MKPSVLVAGFATRHIVSSAYRAGYRVYAVDHFCDMDLRRYTDDCIVFDELDELQSAVEGICSRHEIDLMVAASGAELISPPVRLFGSSPDIASLFLNKLRAQQFFEKKGFNVPMLVQEGHYPAMLKPCKGAGGWRNRVIRSAEDLSDWKAEWPGEEYICQELVEGAPVSVSCLSDGKNAVAVAINEQYLRGSEDASHGFCGSVTPFIHSDSEMLVSLAEEIAAASGCTGSLGIDFVLGDEVWVIEINPRFQATLDTVERATGINLFMAHLDACRGVLPVKRPFAHRFAARSILFADRDLVVRDDLGHMQSRVADIPPVGTRIEDGHALISVFGEGSTRDDACRALDNNITELRTYIDQW